MPVLSFRLYLAQRISAMIMAPLLLLHLAVIIYAVRGGLDAAEILARTQGSFLWGLVYGTMVLAVSIHAPIGLRVIVYEWFGIKGTALNAFTLFFAALLLGMGGRAVYAVVT